MSKFKIVAFYEFTELKNLLGGFKILYILVTTAILALLDVCRVFE